MFFGSRLSGEQEALLETARDPVCLVCARAEGAARRALEGVLRDGVTDVRVRADWRKRGGLCGHHWRVWRHLDSPPLSTAILTEDLLQSYLDAGNDHAPRCFGCEIRTRVEERALKALRSIPLGRLDEALAEGPGLLCLRHYEALPDGDVKARFEARFRLLLEHLREQVRTSDHRFVSERRGPHADAWLRALRVFGADV